MLPADDCWRAVAEAVDFAFQPIVNVHTGTCYGYEALLRDWQEAGFSSIQAVFDAAHEDLALYRLDLMLREKAVEKFASIPHHARSRLFYNLDNRVLDMPDYAPGNTSVILAAHGVASESLCFEISERLEVKNQPQTQKVLTSYRHDSHLIALDDYGVGFSGLQLLYHSEPDFIKIDRFFIEGIARNVKKRLFVSNVINMAHMLGITVIAEGVETPQEFCACRDMGCDLIQGYLIQRPTTQIDELSATYPLVGELNSADRRRSPTDEHIVADWIERVEPVSVASPMAEVCRRFNCEKDRTSLPIINRKMEPVGIVRESDVRQYTYARYGLELLMNPALRGTLRNLVTPCMAVEMSTSVERILQQFTLGPQAEGMVVTTDGRYVGYLSAANLIGAMNEKNIQVARDENPLTRLPGNSSIHQYLQQALADEDFAHAFAYFDFDFFKVFNDANGFRVGDRAIVMFADLLRHSLAGGEHFVGHVGGDDFFAGFRLCDDVSLARVRELTRGVIERFNRDAMSFYDAEAQHRGWIEGTGRDGVRRQFPLLRVSAAIIHLPCPHPEYSLEELGSAMARAKETAKDARDHFYQTSLRDGDQAR